MNLTKNLTFIIAFNIYNSNVLFQYLDSFKRGLGFKVCCYSSLYLVVTIQGYMCGFKDNMMGSHRVIASVEQNSSNFRTFYFHCLNECIQYHILAQH